MKIGSAEWYSKHEGEPFPEKLRLLRWTFGATQKEAAKMIGVSPSALIKYEGSSLSPSIGVAIKMAKAYGVSLDWLFSREMEEAKNG